MLDCGLQVADWARQRFEEEVKVENESFNLPKACMLIALEEEAAEALHGLSGLERPSDRTYHDVFFPRDRCDRCAAKLE